MFLYPFFELTDFDIDEHKNLLHAVGTLRLMWVDMRLAYAYTPDCEDAFGNQYWWILSPAYHDRIWQSSWYFVDGSARPATTTLSLAIYPSGSITHNVRVDDTFRCQLDLRHLPFDEQECSVTIGFAPYDTQRVQYWEPQVTLGTHGNNAWRIEGTSATVDTVIRTSKDYSEAHMTFRFKRKPNFYFLQTVLPAMMFLLINYVGFWVDRHVGPARVAIAVIPVLIMLTLQTQSYARMQVLSYVTRLTKFLITCQVISVACVLEYGAVCYFLGRERIQEERRRCMVKSNKLLLSHLEVFTEGGAPAAAEGLAPFEFSRDRPRVRALTLGDVPIAGPHVDVLVERGGGPYAAEAVAVPKLAKKASSRRLMSVVQMQRGALTDPLTDRLLDALRAVFDRADSDHSGTINHRELATSLQNYGYYVTPDQAYLTMVYYKRKHGSPIMDPNDAMFDFKEFVDLVGSGPDAIVSGSIVEDPLFFTKPRSLQLDILCRILFLPVTIALTAVALGVDWI